MGEAQHLKYTGSPPLALMDARYPSSLCQEPPPECPGHLRFSDGIFKVLWVLYLIKCASSRASFRARNKSFGGRKNLAEKPKWKWPFWFGVCRDFRRSVRKGFTSL